MEHLTHIIKALSKCAENAYDKRKGNNLSHSLRDIIMSGFAVFWFQSSSWLNFQNEMQTATGLSNLKTLLGCNRVPTDNHIRNILDSINPNHFGVVYDEIHNELIKNNVYDKFVVFGNRMLISLDGTEYFKSDKLNCEFCNHKYHKNNDKFEYYHSMLGITICSPNTTDILPLAPIFIDKNNNKLTLEQKKQDCEHNALVRFFENDCHKYTHLKPIFLLDALFADNKVINLIHEHINSNFIITAKEGKSKTAFEFINNCYLNKITIIHKINSNTKESWTYEWLNGIPLTNSLDTNRVNYISLTTHKLLNIDQRSKLNKKLRVRSKYRTIDDEIKPKKYAFFTDIEVNQENIEDLISYGRTRWRLENGYNSLKKRGYNFEHNFGHGKKYLSSVLATFMVLAFLLHTSSAFLDEIYNKAVHQFTGKIYFYRHIKFLTHYFVFSNFRELLLTIISKNIKSAYYNSS
jgi:hypothetical protein